MRCTTSTPPSLLRDEAEMRTIISTLHLQRCLQCNSFLYPNNDKQQLNDHLIKCRSCPMLDCEYKSIHSWSVPTFLAHIRSQHCNISAPITDSMEQYFEYHDVAQCSKCYWVYARGSGFNHHVGKCNGIIDIAEGESGRRRRYGSSRRSQR